jgi:hypothetical protein
MMPLEISGHEIISLCGLRTLKENVVVRILAPMHRLGRPDPKTFSSYLATSF